MGVWGKGKPKPAGWEAVRRAVLQRDQHSCKIQGRGCLGRATHVDHIHGSAGPLTDPQFLQAACSKCNTSKGDPTKYISVDVASWLRKRMEK